MGEVYLTVERAAVTIAVIGSFTAIVLTGHLTQQVADIMGPLLGAIALAWFGGHTRQVQQQGPAATIQVQATDKAA